MMVDQVLHRYYTKNDGLQRLLLQSACTGSDNTTNNKDDEDDEYYLQYHDDDDLIFGSNPIEKATVVMSQIAALISLLSILCIVLEVGHDISHKKGTVVSRILLSWAIGSTSLSLGFLMGTWGIPQDLNQYIWGASGTQGTCTLQGVLAVMGLLMTILWDTVLSLTYVWMVKYNWPKPKLEKWEKAAHVIIWPTVLTYLVLALRDKGFNASRDICYLAPAPYGCEQQGDDLSNCTRGLNANSLLAFIPLGSIVAVCIAIGSMITLYCTVRNQEKKNERYTKQYTTKQYTTTAPTGSTIASSSGTMSTTSMGTRNSMASSRPSTTQQQQKKPKLSRQVGIQGILYSSIWLFCCLPTTVVILLWGYAGIFHQAVYLVTQFVGCLYGFWYLLVYLRRREEMKTRYGKLVKRILCCRQKGCCFCQGREEQQQQQADNHNFKEAYNPKSTESLGDLSGVMPNNAQQTPSSTTTSSSPPAMDAV